VKTVAFPTRLKLSESANFNGNLIKFKPPNQLAQASWQLISANEESLAFIHLTALPNRKYNTLAIFIPPVKLLRHSQQDG